MSEINEGRVYTQEEIERDYVKKEEYQGLLKLLKEEYVLNLRNNK